MRKIHLLLTLVALIFATLQLWAAPSVAVDGKLPGAFSVACGEYVYFSQGNLRATTTDLGQHWTWSFAENQWEYVGNTSSNQYINGNGTVSQNGTVDLFCWVGASSIWTGAAQYGITNRGNESKEKADGFGTSWTETLKKDWGTLAISNGGNTANSGWRTLSQSEWNYLFKSRLGNRYATAIVHGERGFIILPDGWTQEGSAMINPLLDINVDSKYNEITDDDWSALETDGAVFLPQPGWRTGSAPSSCGTTGWYWSTTPYGAYAAYCVRLSGNAATGQQNNRYCALSVRLVKDVPEELEPAGTKASAATPPTAYSNLTYNGWYKSLIDHPASNLTGGKDMYRLGTSGEWTNSYSTVTATNAGTYTVQWFVEASGSGCYIDSDIEEFYVTIARGTASAPNPIPTVAAATSLAYTGSAQDLVSADGSLQDGYTLVYSTDGVNWSTTIPQGTNADDYTVYYKFYKGDNYEYVPSPNEINVTIAKGDLSGVTLPEATSSIPYDGTEKTLLEVDPVAGATIWYKLGDGEWTTTPPTATDADDYSVQYKIVPDDPNYNTIGPNTVTVTILDYPTVYDNADPTAKLTELLNTPSDLKIKRTIYADDEYNTICLPFSLDESALAASPLAGFNRLKTFKGAQVTGTAPDLYIDIFVEDATTIEAGIPYLITYPAAHADIVDPVFNGITVTTTEPSAVSVDGITFQGMFAQVHIDPYDAGHTQDYLFVGANSQLYWPSSDQTSSSIKMRGFRAYFIIDRNSISPALAPKGTRARIMDAPKTTTAIDNTSAKFGGSEKIIENGILYIIRNGVKYNAQGQIVK